MNVIEAMNKRKAIRAFKPDPVPKEVLCQVMEAATRAPSWNNHQPWEFAILGGKVIDEVKEALQGRILQRVAPIWDNSAPNFLEHQMERGRVGLQARSEILGIARGDRESRLQNTLKGARFFDAPNGIIVYTDKQIGPWAILDAGLVSQSILLAAVEYGLGTCMQAATVSQPDVLRSILGIPESKHIVVGIAIGYPDWDEPINNLRTQREPLENVVRWHGF